MLGVRNSTAVTRPNPYHLCAHMMIPGAYETRRQSAVPVDDVVGAGRGAQMEPVARRHELPGWLKVSIFAVTLLVVMWLTMAVFFKPIA